jgi:hypothetical protein
MVYVITFACFIPMPEEKKYSRLNIQRNLLLGVSFIDLIQILIQISTLQHIQEV